MVLHRLCTPKKMRVRAVSDSVHLEWHHNQHFGKNIIYNNISLYLLLIFSNRKHRRPICRGIPGSTCEHDSWLRDTRVESPVSRRWLRITLVLNHRSNVHLFARNVIRELKQHITQSRTCLSSWNSPINTCEWLLMFIMERLGWTTWSTKSRCGC